MKFDCGETHEERKARLGQWHRWFAWHPAKLGDHDCRWLEVVDRKGTYHESYCEEWWTWEYRPAT